MRTYQELAELALRSSDSALAPIRFTYLLQERFARMIALAFSPFRKKRKCGPGCDFEGAGVPARLKPPPSLISGTAARSFPPTDEENA